MTNLPDNVMDLARKFVVAHEERMYGNHRDCVTIEWRGKNDDGELGWYFSPINYNKFWTLTSNLNKKAWWG